MKIILIFFFIFLFSCCADSLTEPEIAQYQIIAFESLSENEKSTIIDDVNDATVEKGKYEMFNGSSRIKFEGGRKYYFFLKDKSITLKPNQSLIAVSFRTKDGSLLGPITVIINPSKNIVIGFVGRL